MHPWSVRIEDPRDLDLQCVLTVIIEEQRLGAPFPFVIAAAWADRIDSPPIRFRLRMHFGIAVYLARRRLHDPRSHSFCEAQHVDRTVHARLRRLHGVVLVVHRRSGAGQIVDLVDFDVERKRHIVPHYLEVRLSNEMRDVVLRSREEIVDAQNRPPVGDEPLTEMRPKESSAAGDKNAFACVH